MKTPITRLTTLLVALLLPAAAQAAEHPARLLLLTKLIDQVPTKAQLVEAGAGAHGEALYAIAADETLPRYPRARAASMLGHFDTPKARGRLADLLDDPRIVDREVKIQALAALVRLEGPASLERLSDLSVHPDPELRAAAIRNLGRVEHPRVQAILQARLAEGAEPVRWVRELAARTARR